MNTTNWACSADASGNATLAISKNGNSTENILLKGLCYSPCPINDSNAFAPAIGDFFWDSFSGPNFNITGWEALWARDLPNIRSLGANTIRVYSMLSRQLNDDGTYPSPWNSGTLMTHQNFLDQCWNNGVDPIYVLVGIPLPQAMFWYNEYQTTPATEIDYWTNVLTETVQQLAGHPAVMGFIVQNEMDSNVVTYGPHPNSVPFWWSQCELMAQNAKTAMGTNQKLVGMAVHDDPNIPGTCQAHMAQCTAIDFWGVNTYQTQSFNTVFNANPNIGPGYNGLTGAALKPVILTEWGMPATSHSDSKDPSTIYADATTIGKAAAVITNVAPDAYQQSLCLGLYYFEYCDEWWNQGRSPNIYTWYGGSAAPGFPNGYWDQEGFGIYAQARGGSLANSAAVWIQDGGDGAPNTPIDTVTVRQGTFSALSAVFNSIVVQVSAKTPWQDTGVVVANGQQPVVTYLSGSWTADPKDNNGHLYDGTGSPDVVVPANQPKYPIVGVKMGALIGRVGNNGVPFLIGDGPTTVPAGLVGDLQVCINDDLTGAYGAGLTDNKGSIRVQVVTAS